MSSEMLHEEEGGEDSDRSHQDLINGLGRETEKKRPRTEVEVVDLEPPPQKPKRHPGAVLNDRRFLHRPQEPNPAINELNVDKFYFESYAHLSIHEEMIRDSVRTGAYRQAILDNSGYLKGKVVMDVGCGTGILSLFCAEAGAKKVYAIEASGMADYAKKAIESNMAKGGTRGEQASRVQIIKGKVEDIELDEKVDVIVSEWMGYSLLYESMLDSVIVARDRWLKEDGVMFPSTARLYLTAFTDEQVYSSRTEFWQDVYGWDYSVMIPYAVKCAFSEPEVDVLPAENQLSFPQLLHTIDLKTVTSSQLNQIQTKDFVMSMFGSSQLHGFCLWFDVLFPQLSHPGTPIVLSTSPDQPPTHWKQSLMYLDEPIQVTQDQKMKGCLQILKADDNPRFLVIHLQLHSVPVVSSASSPLTTTSSSAVVHKTFHVR